MFLIDIRSMGAAILVARDSPDMLGINSPNLENATTSTKFTLVA